jgi:hypothetical protein
MSQIVQSEESSPEPLRGCDFAVRRSGGIGVSSRFPAGGEGSVRCGVYHAKTIERRKTRVRSQRAPRLSDPIRPNDLGSPDGVVATALFHGFSIVDDQFSSVHVLGLVRCQEDHHVGHVAGFTQPESGAGGFPFFVFRQHDVLQALERPLSQGGIDAARMD